MDLSTEATIAWITLAYLLIGFLTLLMAGILTDEYLFAIVIFWFIFIIPVMYKMIKFILKSTIKGLKKSFKIIYKGEK